VGADKARALATPFITELRHAVGLRNLATGTTPQGKAKSAKAALPGFKQYREADGRHYFKLVDAAGRLLAQSTGFESPQEAGRAIAQLKQGGLSASTASLQLAEGVAAGEITAALAALSQA
jgi:tryptophanyl-tRNA synthetase